MRGSGTSCVWLWLYGAAVWLPSPVIRHERLMSTECGSRTSNHAPILSTTSSSRDASAAPAREAKRGIFPVRTSVPPCSFSSLWPSRLSSILAAYGSVTGEILLLSAVSYK